MSEKTRYSDEELQEFKELILDKLSQARQDYQLYSNAITHVDENGTEDTSTGSKDLGDRGQEVVSKSEARILARRQLEFIQKLDAALVRIENKTYGICRETGKLISKDRLHAVPHATLSIEAKNHQREPAY